MRHAAADAAGAENDVSCHCLLLSDTNELLIAAISREVFEQIGPIPGDPRDLFEATLARADAMVIR
ncbi:hypothetical protein GCM10009810_26020 [Nostocoides vanveenii]|uniref:Uncharacterized protein n=1 Tax=Nostocoides vanveenii TaxID=330835 RepID=A0ABP4X5K1_9MICO